MSVCSPWPHRFLITVFSCLSICLAAQTSHIDSLQKAIQLSKDDKQKSELYSTLSESLYQYDFEKALASAEKGLQLSIKTNSSAGQAHAYTALGTYHYYNGDHSNALLYYHKALSSIRTVSDEDFPAQTYLRLSILYRQQADFDSSRWYLEKTKEEIKGKKVGLLHALLLTNEGLLANALSKNEEALVYLKKSLQVYTQLNDSIRIAEALSYTGTVFTNLSEYDSAEVYFDKAQNLIVRVKDPEATIILNLSRGETYFATGNFNQAIKHYTDAMNAVKANTYKRYHAFLLYKIGELYENQGAYPTAYDYLFNALKEFEKINAKQDMARAYTQIGWCYIYQENYALALENANKALTIAKQISDPDKIAQNQNLIGYAYYKTKNYKEALPNFESAIAIRKQIKHWWGVSFSLYNAALTYIEIGHTDKAFQLLNESLQIDQRIGKKIGIVLTSNELGYQYTKLKKFDKATYYLQQAQTLAKSIPSPPALLSNYKNQIFLHEQQKDNRGTIAYYKLYTTLKDSLSNEINSSRISQADALFQLQKKANEISLIHAENELNRERIKVQDAEINFQKRVIIIVSLCVIILLLFVFLIYKLVKNLRKKNKEISEQQEEIMSQSEELTESNSKLYDLNAELNEKNQEVEAQAEKIAEANHLLAEQNNQLEKGVEERTAQLKKAYDELETFFYKTSHDFRRPLTTYLGLVQLAESSIKDDNALYLFEKVRETTLGLDAMLLKLQSISTIDSDVLLTEIDVYLLVEECCEKFTETIRLKNIGLTKNVKVTPIKSNYTLLKVALENLIENAANFSRPETAFIKIHAFQSADTVHIEVEDNGQGISDHLQSRVFEMYYRANENSRGNGLGLYVARRAVEKLGGTISFRSRQYNGSTFTIKLPL